LNTIDVWILALLGKNDPLNGSFRKWLPSIEWLSIKAKNITSEASIVTLAIS
jgi:hypothetical protein